jgi:membrane associated rhomboid family serine protease
MFFPLRDHNPTRSTPLVTIALIAANLLIWFIELGQGERFADFLARWGATPFELTHFEDLIGSVPDTPIVHVPGPAILWITPLSSMFLHAGWVHLIFNMHFLWLFGNNVEDALGRARYLLFYLVWGLLGLLLHVATDPNSLIPTVGASGAISGVLGAYLMLYPRARVTSLLFLGFFIQFLQVPAVVLIVVWTLLQIFGGLATAGNQGGGTAYWAHLGGLAAGYFTTRWLARDRLAAQGLRQQWLRR